MTGAGLVLRAPRIRIPGRPEPHATARDLAIEPGRCVVLLGRSGAGKTLLCRLAAGMGPPPPLVGEGMPATAARRGVDLGFVPQGGRENLVPGWSVARHLELLQLDFGATSEVAERLGLDLTSNLAATAVEMSEGMIRRLLIAMVLARRPRLLVVDEPTSGLDPDARGRAVAALAEAVAGGAGALVSTHSLPVARALGTSFGLVEDGAVVEVAEALAPGGPFAPWLEVGEGALAGGGGSAEAGA